MPFGMPSARTSRGGAFRTMAGGMTCRSALRRSRRPPRSAHGASLGLALGPSRLRRIGPKQAILQRSTVEPANDRVHLLRVGRFDEREALGLLRFGVADDFNCVRYQVFGCQPALDIVRGDPGGQIAQKHGEAHSAVVCISVRGGFAPGGLPEGNIIVPQWIKPVNGPIPQYWSSTTTSPDYFTTSEYGMRRCTPPCANDFQGSSPTTALIADSNSELSLVLFISISSKVRRGG
jgi:hypothetical protein